MQVSFIRRNTSSQISHCYGGSVRYFEWFQLGTTGWTNGARNRVKTFNSFTAVYAYLNKLHIGRYLDDSSYERAWIKVLDLESAQPKVDD